jgi:hypothetical protein
MEKNGAMDNPRRKYMDQRLEGTSNDGLREDWSVGYVSIVELGSGLYRGGMLLVDWRGKPQDFRCTSAIKPNTIQRVLYGGTLIEHMALKLCGLPLLHALPKTPTVLLADCPELLLLRTHADIPSLWIRRQGEIQSSGKTIGIVGGELIASEGGVFDTVLASCCADYGEDLAEAVETVRQLGQALDPLEPFARISAALKLVQDKAGAR